MKRLVAFFPFFIFVTAFSILIGVSAPTAGPVIVVMDIETGSGVETSLSVPITMVVIDEVTSWGAYQVMDRARREEILKEKGFKWGDCREADCYRQAGKLIGAAFVVTGRIDKVGSSYLMVLQRVNIESGMVESTARETVTGDTAALIAAAATAAKKLTPPKPPVTYAEPPSPTAPPPPLRSCRNGMVYIPEGNFCIDRFEYPNKKGEIPKNYVTAEKAADLCRKDGKRLPTETEFEAACIGSRKLPFGYGDKFKKGACNLSGGFKGAKAVPSGSLEGCSNDYGVFDMVGNVWEWTDGGSRGRPVLKGGSYMSSLPSYVTCGERHDPQEQQGIGWGGGYDFGFRCAKDAE